MAGLVDIGADAANNAEIEADMAASVLCDIWHLDDAKGALHLPHRGATLPWAELQRSGVQHFKMVLPDDASSYSWAADPELKEVRKLNQFEYGRLLKVAAEGAATEGGEEEDRVAAAERAYFLSADEHLHTADLILFCVAGSAYVDVRHHAAGNGWVRVHLKDGDMLQIPEGCFYRWSLDESGQASVVALSTEPPSTETPALTPAAVAAYQKRHGGEEEPSRARYHYLHVRPKPRGWRSLFEPARDIDYNLVVIEEMVCCALGVLVFVLGQIWPDIFQGFWLVASPFPFMLVWSLIIRRNYEHMQEILLKGKIAVEDKKQR